MSLPDLLIFIPIIAAAAMAFGMPARMTALAAAGVNLLLGLYLAVQFDYSATAPAMQFTPCCARVVLESPHIAFGVGIDGMSLVMVLLTVIVTAAAVAQRPAKPGDAMYYASCLLIAAGALGAFVATDLVFFFAFHELALIPTFLMIGLRGSGNNKEAAWKITVYLGFGSMILLVGLAWLAVAAAQGGPVTFDMAALTHKGGLIEASTQANIYATLLIGFGVLISLFPFHSWAAPAYASAPTAVTMLHAGVLKKFGLYGLLRVAVPMLPLGHSTEWVQHLLIVLLLGNILWVGLVTIAQRELDTVLANSSVMHMGYVFLGIVSNSVIGYSGAIMLMFAHGISIALLFALSSIIKDRTGTLQFHRLGGLATKAPWLGLVFGMATMASIGLPAFANFAGEINIFFGGFANTGHCLGWTQWATILALWGVVMSAVYMLRAYRAVFKGDTSPASAAASDVTLWSARIPLLLLLAALLIAGFFPGVIYNAIYRVVEAIPHR